MAKFSAGVIDTDVKFATSVGDAGGKYTAGVVDTGGKFATPSVADTSGAAWLATANIFIKSKWP